MQLIVFSSFESLLLGLGKVPMTFHRLAANSSALSPVCYTCSCDHSNDNTTTTLAAFHAMTNIHNSFQCHTSCGSQVLFGHILDWPEIGVCLCYIKFAQSFSHLQSFDSYISFDSSSSYFRFSDICIVSQSIQMKY